MKVVNKKRRFKFRGILPAIDEAVHRIFKKRL